MSIEMFSKSMAEGFALIASLAALSPNKDNFSLMLGGNCSPYTLTSKPILEVKCQDAGTVYRITFTGRAVNLAATSAEGSQSASGKLDGKSDPLPAERRFRFEMHVNEKTQEVTLGLLSGTHNQNTGRWSWQEASPTDSKYPWAKEAA